MITLDQAMAKLETAEALYIEAMKAHTEAKWRNFKPLRIEYLKRKRTKANERVRYYRKLAEVLATRDKTNPFEAWNNQL